MAKHAQKTKAKRRTSQAGRTALIAKIHIAKKELWLDDDTYRDVLERVTGKRSCSGMSIRELEAVIADMENAGFTVKPAKKHGKKPNVTTRKKALIRKIEAMLADMNLPWGYAVSMAKQMFNREAIEFLNDEKLYKLTQALAVHQARRQDKQPKV